MNQQLLHDVDLTKLGQAIQEEIAYTKTIEKEQQTKSIQELRKEGRCITPCTFFSKSDFLNGSLYTFKTSYVLNDSFFKKGSQVLLQIGNSNYKGKITDLNAVDFSIFVHDEIQEDLYENAIRVDYSSDERTFECMRFGLNFFQTKPELQAIFLQQVSVSLNTPFQHSELNQHQQKAVSEILGTRLLTCIQGPPGTGKTHTLSIAIQELVKRGKRIIITAPSNTAVDHLCRQITPSISSLIRVGNEEKIADSILPFTIDELIQNQSNGMYFQQAKKQIQKLEQIANRHIRNYTKEAAEEKRNAQKELKIIYAERRKMSRELESNLLHNASIIAGTPVGLFNQLPKDFKADYVIMDEAGQALLPLTLLVASFGKQLVLCGDPQQLPPVVLSQKAKDGGLGKSLLEVLYQKREMILLTEQYRMPEKVVSLINPFFYENKLITSKNESEGSVLYIDTSGFGSGEQQNEETGSIQNEDEALLIKKIIQEFDLKPHTTSILTPYNAQIALIQSKIGLDWHVSTIDSIQGQEQETILYNLTRSNMDGEIGFLKDYRRTNVAISRAKKQLILVGDSSTLGADPFYNELIENLEKMGAYKSVWEFEL